LNTRLQSASLPPMRAGHILDWLGRYIPLLATMRIYRCEWLRPDILAGATLWSVMVPTALAYAGIAGVPPLIGMFTVPLPLIAYACLGTSRTLVVGPDSATALLSAHTIAALAATGSPDYLALTVELAFWVGLIFLLAGALRLGWVASFISQPVMNGFIQGLALVTMLTQLPKMFGVAPVGGHFFTELWHLLRHWPMYHWPTMAVGFSALVLLFGLPRYYPRLPPALTVVAAGIVVSLALGLDRHGVAVVGAIPAGLPRLAVPHFEWAHLGLMLHGALAIVLLNYTESLGAAKVAALKVGGEVNPNQELLALGMANLGSSCSSGFVVAGSLSQSAVSMTAGGKTPVAGLVLAGLALLTLQFLMPVFARLPAALLGAIVVRAMIKLFNPGYFRALFRISRLECLYAAAAALGVLLFGVLQGVGVGMVLALLVLIYRSTHPDSAVLGKVPGMDAYRDVTRHPEAITIPGLLIFRLDSSLLFMNAAFCADRIQQHIATAITPVSVVLMDMETVNALDTTAAETLKRLQSNLAGKGISLRFARVRDPVRGMMEKTGLASALGPGHIYESITAGVEDFGCVEGKAAPSAVGHPA